MKRDALSGALITLTAVAAAFLSAAATAHPGGIAGDGCHDHRAHGTCHCHRPRAVRPGCTEWGEGGHGSSDGAEPGAGGIPAGTSPPAAGAPPAPAEWIRIATWNLNRLHWRTGGALWRGAVARSGEDYETLARYARALDADVIAFQEVNGPRAAARVFPSRDYALYFSGRYDSRYDDIYNGFAVRKDRFDHVEKRDYEALGLGSGPATSSGGASTSRSGGTDRAFACSTSISSRNASPRASRTLATGTAASSPGRSVPSNHGSTPAGARARPSSCWATSTARWTGTDGATTCGGPSTTATRRA